MCVSRGLVLVALVGCASSVDVGGGDDESGGRITRARWVREEIDRWNAHLDAAGRDEKYAKLRESPHTFFRGANHIFWKDHLGVGDLARYGGTATWIQGDCHVENFGTFDDADGDLVYGLNDFDDGWIADVQLDLWRLATSILLFASENDVAPATATAAVDALAGAYLDAMVGFADGDAELAVQFDDAHTSGAVAELLAKVAAEESPAELLGKWTVGEGDARRFDLTNPDLAATDGAAVIAALGVPVRDVALRLHAGTSSLGVTRYYVLLADEVILEVKAASRRLPGPTYLAGLDGDGASIAAEAQGALGKDVDPYLQPVRVAGAPYLVRALSPWKDSLSKKKLKAALVDTAAQWGEMLAAAHARGDRDFDASLVGVSIDDEIVARAAADAAGFKRLVLERASSYAAQVARDFAAFAETPR